MPNAIAVIVRYDNIRGEQVVATNGDGRIAVFRTPGAALEYGARLGSLPVAAPVSRAGLEQICQRYELAMPEEGD